MNLMFGYNLAMFYCNLEIPMCYYSLTISRTQSSGQLGAHPNFLVAGEQVLLQTVIVPVRSADGKNLINARVILDSTSQRTL